MRAMRLRSDVPADVRLRPDVPTAQLVVPAEPFLLLLQLLDALVLCLHASERGGWEGAWGMGRSVGDGE